MYAGVGLSAASFTNPSTFITPRGRWLSGRRYSCISLLNFPGASFIRYRPLAWDLTYWSIFFSINNINCNRIWPNSIYKFGYKQIHSAFPRSDFYLKQKISVSPSLPQCRVFASFRYLHWLAIQRVHSTDRFPASFRHENLTVISFLHIHLFKTPK